MLAPPQDAQNNSRPEVFLAEVGIKSGSRQRYDYDYFLTN